MRDLEAVVYWADVNAAAIKASGALDLCEKLAEKSDYLDAMWIIALMYGLGKNEAKQNIESLKTFVKLAISSQMAAIMAVDVMTIVWTGFWVGRFGFEWDTELAKEIEKYRHETSVAHDGV